MNTKMLILLLMMALSVSAMAVNLDGTWYTGSKSGIPYLSSTTSNTFTWGQGEKPTSTTATEGALWSYFTDLTLTQPGDRITLDFYLTLNDAAEGGRDFRFGLFNNGGTRVETNLPGANADAGFLDTLGYFVRWSINPAGSIYLYTRTAGATNPVSTTNSITLATAGGNPGVPISTTCHFTFSVTVINDAEYEVTATLDTGSAVKTVSATTTQTGTATFNNFSFLNTLTEIGSMTFENIKVVYNDWAWNPNPVIGEINVGLTPTLSWSTGTDPNNPASPNPAITAHKLYGNLADADDPNMFLIAELPAGTTTYPVTGLERDKTYKWRIDEVVEPNAITGLEWTFDTVLSIPDITGDPEDVRAFEGEPASLTVVATNPFTGNATGLTYQWYRGLPGDTSTPVSGATSATYAIPSAAVADEGSYYCIVTITSNGQTSESQAAELIVNRLFAHYEFDGDATDATGVYDGTESGSPTYTTGGGGVIGEAIVLDGTDDKVEYTFAQETEIPQFTLTFWAQTSDTGQSDSTSLFNNGDGASPYNFQIDMSGTGNYDYTGGTWIRTFGAAEIDTWILLGVTYDGTTTRLYADGEFVDSTGAPHNRFDRFCVGVNRGNSLFFQGLIDDVRVYNYALTGIEMAQAYTDVMGGEICAEPVAYDLNDDCKIDLQDFAIFAATWAECGLVPDCLP